MATIINPREVLPRAFPGMQENEAEEMIARGEVITYPANTILCQEGALEMTFYILLEGEVKVTKVINEAETRLLKRLHPGDFFGEMALIHNAPRAATVTTVATTTVLVIHKQTFDDLIERSSSMSMAMVREVSRRLRDNDEMAIEDLRFKAKELAEAYSQLTELEYARNQFLTTIAHELRTPLMAANGFMQVIRMGNLQGEALKSALDTVSRNLQDIISLTNDILFLQEMDLILPNFDAGDVGAVVASSVDQQRISAERNQVRMKLAINPGIPRIPIDPKSLGRAFNAILNNAIKFSPEGGDVLIEIDHEDDQVWVKVEDHGLGIPPEAIPRIFDRFYHIDQIGSHLFRGVGLGLSIAREVIEQHHGKIEVQSELGKGSTFIIWLNCP